MKAFWGCSSVGFRGQRSTFWLFKPMYIYIVCVCVWLLCVCVCVIIIVCVCVCVIIMCVCVCDYHVCVWNMYIIIVICFRLMNTCFYWKFDGVAFISRSSFDVFHFKHIFSCVSCLDGPKIQTWFLELEDKVLFVFCVYLLNQLSQVYTS